MGSDLLDARYWEPSSGAEIAASGQNSGTREFEEF